MNIIKFGNYSNRTICTIFFLTGSLILLRLLYPISISINTDSSKTKLILFDLLLFYRRFVMPFIIILFTRFLTEIIYKLIGK
ncbi:MAG: hypothetical protein LBV08_03545 [Clostridiales bacterium]|jgi:hypothetical protein|nr:hypothetical protein [Clostridiales bacterium]